mgnify:CR=1 FL=1
MVTAAAGSSGAGTARSAHAGTSGGSGLEGLLEALRAEVRQQAEAARRQRELLETAQDQVGVRRRRVVGKAPPNGLESDKL